MAQRGTGPETGPAKGGQVAEVKALLGDLTVDKPRSYRNMIVFPLRYGGRQAPGEWETMDKALDAGHLKVSEKERATVPTVQVENLSDRTIFLMSGEIISGGKQTRIIREDVILEPRQRVAVPVFCVEQHRWSGKVEFGASRSLAPASVNAAVQRGADQSEVWDRVRQKSAEVGVASPTGSLEDALKSERTQKEFKAAHEALGKFSPPDTIGVAVADARTGRVLGLELFGRRDLFENLQDKLIEGYAADLVLGREEQAAGKPVSVTDAEVAEFIRRALAGSSQYEDTPGSGRGIDLRSGEVRGKGVGLSEMAVHLSIQETRHRALGAKPIVDDPVRPMPMPVR